MDDTGTDDDRLLSRAEVASLAGVMRPAVTNWQRRHADYPKPVRAGETELFSLRAVLGWLASRQIPSRARTADEATGFTYADRVQRNLATEDVRQGEGTPVGGKNESRPASDERQRARQLERLLGPLADTVRGGGSLTDYLALLISLIFLRTSESPRTAALLDEARMRTKAAAALLGEIGEVADDALRMRGVTPGMRTALLRLEPQEYADVVETIGLTEGLGIDELRQLIDQYGVQAALPSNEFFTPRAVVRLMRDAAVGEEDTVQHVYDPYVRGGEMLDGVAERLGGAVPLTLRGEGPQRATMRLASMNLALHGATVELGSRSVAPWDERAWPTSQQADLVLTNPPFNTHGVVPKPREGLDWPYGQPPPGTAGAVFGWLQHVLTSLKDGGRAAVVMPVSAGASTDPRAREIRRRLVEDGAVECVVALPPRLFSGAQVSVCLWFLRRSATVLEEILFVDARGLGDKATRGPRVLSEEHVGAIADTVRRWRRSREFRSGRQDAGHLAVAAPLEAVQATAYSLNPSDFVDRWMSAAATPVDAVRELAAAEQAVSSSRYRAHAADGAADAIAFAPARAEVFSYDGLPQDWRRVPLRTLADITAGPSYARLPIGARSVEGDLPVVMPRHLRAGRIEGRDMEKVTEDMGRALSRFRLSPGDIVCVRSGAQMPPAMVDETQDGWIFSTNLLRLRVSRPGGGPVVDPGYLLAYLSLPETLQWLKEQARGTAVPSLSVAALELLPVPLPPLAHQRRISAALEAMDAQIAAHSELVRAVKEQRVTLAAHLMTGVLVPE
ncbi:MULTISPECIES: N-6 DNA methylase [unclassified Streptomyces]|uniref:N-6 DNA methylase n=1 Tax=unclassified Streptomyces TaxID=2593676 RepID=UPI00344F4EBC